MTDSKGDATPAGNLGYKREVNFWAFMDSILSKGMDKGIFGLTVFGLILLIIIIKYPSAELPALLSGIGRFLRSWGGVGWVLLGAVIFGWYRSSKSLRESRDAEMDRLGVEKGDWQNKALERKLSRSRQKKE